MKMYRLISYRADGQHVYYTKARYATKALNVFKNNLRPELFKDFRLTEVPFDCIEIISVNYIY